MRTSDFEFDLPERLIAQQPASPRDSARLMTLDRSTQEIGHHTFRDLPALLRPGDLLVLNDTRVMAARLHGARAGTGGAVEALLVRELGPRRWEVLLRPARAARPGVECLFRTPDGPLSATVVERTAGEVILQFARDFDAATVGEVPLPPYIKGYHGDPEEYQTVYSREAKSAAAPTAGLHFTPALLQALQQNGIDSVPLTLHVGPGTFRPVAADDPRDHNLHAEFVRISLDAASAIQAARDAGRRVVAVGTTVVRTLEHVRREAGGIVPYEGWTTLKILPGEPFQAVDALITNFHLPRSTLLMLVCAFAGQEFVLRAYREAVERQYRFYSFGDAMLVV